MSKTLYLGVLLGLAITSWCMAGFNYPGHELQVVKSEQGLENAAISFHTNPLWIDFTPEKPYNFNTSFTLPGTNEIIFARLYLNIWGGTNAYTCQVDTTINGTAIGVIDIGGTEDDNPTYDANRTCLYGSGYGSWQVAYSGVSELLYLDGTSNVVDVTVSDPTGNFDGRTIDATLVAVYTDDNLDYVTDYYLIEADGYMRRTPRAPGSPAERIVNVNSINTSDILKAVYTAHYTHGNSEQFDHLYFNGTQLGDNNIAVGAMGTYGPDVLAFDVTDLLLPDSTVLYTIDETVTGATSEFSINAKIALLEIIHTPYHCTEPIVGDVNNDCKVDLADIALLAYNWLECNREPQSACWE